MTAFKSLASAMVKIFYRDKATLFFTFVFPLMFLVVFGLLFRDAGESKTEIGVVGDGPVIVALELGGDQRDVVGARAEHRPGVEPLVHDRLGLAEHRPYQHLEPRHVRDGQAAQPALALAGAQPPQRGRRRGAQRRRRQHRPLGHARAAAGRDDDRHVRRLDKVKAIEAEG